jgi:hypothetical protein
MEKQMSLFDWFSESLGFSREISLSQHEDLFTDDFTVNPANGLPMIDGIGSVDVEGNPFGCDFSHESISSFDSSSMDFNNDG